MAKFSPHWLESQLEESRQSWKAKLVRLTDSPWKLHLLHLIVATAFALLAFFPQRTLHFCGIRYRPYEYPWIEAVLDHFGMLCGVFAFGSLAPYVPAARLPWLHISGFAVALIVCYHTLPFVTPGATPVAMTFNFIAAFSVFVMIFMAGRRTRKQYLFRGESFVGAYLTLLAGYLVSFVWNFRTGVADFTRMIFPFSFLSLEAQARRRSAPLMEWAMIFSPTVLFTPLPVEAKDRVLTQEWPFRLQGLIDFVTGFLYLVTAYHIRKTWMSFPASMAPFEVLRYGFFSYIYYFFASYAWMALPFGILRWYGLKLPDYFDYPLLATSPVDRWHRWNTYYYNWFYKVIFFPVYRKTGSIAIAVVGVFFTTFIFHSGDLAYGPLLGQRRFLEHPWTRMLAIFFFAHGLLVFVNLKYPCFWPSGRQRKGWWGVGFLMLLMSLVHIFVI